MARGATATEFRRNERVKALDDLPGVPAGTEGRVELVAGFTWTRYRVAFDNGRDVGSIDGRHLSRPREFAAALARRDRAELEEVAVEADGSDGEAAAASAGEDKVVNGVTVPAHLLERSRRARERLAASA
jgi:hypothetical protein